VNRTAVPWRISRQEEEPQPLAVEIDEAAAELSG
jgi:hypothetical protein